MTKEQKKERKRRKAEKRAFDRRLAAKYGLDHEDLTPQMREIFRNAGRFDRSAFDVVDRTRDPNARASLTALAERAVINTFGLKDHTAFYPQNCPHTWNAEANGVVRG